MNICEKCLSSWVLRLVSFVLENDFFSNCLEVALAEKPYRSIKFIICIFIAAKSPKHISFDKVILKGARAVRQISLSFTRSFFIILNYQERTFLQLKMVLLVENRQLLRKSL